MKKRALCWLLTLVMVFSLMPFSALASTASVRSDGTYLYEAATPNDSSKGWTTTDTYTDLYYYDTAADTYYLVNTTSGTIYTYTASTTDKWNAKSLASSGTTYYFKDGTKYCPVKAIQGTLDYTKYTGVTLSQLLPSSDSQHVAWDYGNARNNYYVYDSSKDSAYPLFYRTYGSVIGTGSAKAFAWVVEFFYVADSSVTSSSSNAYANSARRTVKFQGDEEYSYRRDAGWRTFPFFGMGSISSSYSSKTIDIPLYRQESSTGYNAIYYTKDGTDIQLGHDIKIDADLQYAYKNENGPLYTRTPNGTGIVALSYNNGASIGATDERGGTLYSGTLYTRKPLGSLDGEKTLVGRDGNGNYTLTIDSWATGDYQAFTEDTGGGETPAPEPSAEPITTTTALDIVLVIDQSGSMKTADMDISYTDDTKFEATTKSNWTTSDLNSETYYYKANGKYYPVQQGTGLLYSKHSDVRGNKMFGYGHDGISLVVNGAPVYYNVPTDYYILNNGQMYKIFYITAGLDLYYGLYPYVYTSADDAYINKAQWTDNQYWVAIFSPWSPKKLRNNSQWDTLTNSGKDPARISFIDTSGNLLGATDSAGSKAKLSYSWLFNSSFMGELYTAEDSGVTYLYYVDDNGVSQTISNTRHLSSETFGSAQANNTAGDLTLYTVKSGATTRVSALQSAVKNFAAAVADSAAESNVDHRIAVVGFAGTKMPSTSSGWTAYDTTKYDFTNTGLFLNNTFYNYGRIDSNAWENAGKSTSSLYINKHYYESDKTTPIRYDYSGQSWYAVGGSTLASTTTGAPYYKANYLWLNDLYSKALLTVTDNDGNDADNYNDAIGSAIDHFAAYGGTYTSYGVAMAKQILGNATGGTTANRKQVVIVFTDGVPGGSGFETAIANEALAGAAQLKDAGIDVYTVGLYPTSASSQAKTFLRELSSDYTAKLKAVDAGEIHSDASAYKLDGSKTYYYIDEDDGKVYSVNALRNGTSSLGWWEIEKRADGGTTYTLLSVIGKNGAGSVYLYDGDKNAYNGDEVDTTKTYYTKDGNLAIYQYRWYNADKTILDPMTGNATLDAGNDYVQFYELADVTRNADGNEYFMTATDSDSLNQIFADLSETIMSDGESSEPETPVVIDAGTKGTATNYDGTNSVIRDVISSDFKTTNKTTVTLQLVPATMGEDGKIVKNDSGATTATGVTYQWSSDGKTIDVTGFDFGANSIYSGKSGYVMRVIITGLEPTATGKVYSNTNKSGIYAKSGDTVGDLLKAYNNPDAYVDTYTVTWMNDGSAIETDTGVLWGSSPSYDGDAPTKAADDNYVYTFKGWSATEGGAIITDFSAIKVTSDLTYYAVYDKAQVYSDYTVNWIVDGETVETDAGLKTGTHPQFNGDTPSKDGYYFVGWTAIENYVYNKDTAKDSDFYFGDKAVEELAGANHVANLYAVFAKAEDAPVTINEKKVVVPFNATVKIAEGIQLYDVLNQNSGTFDLSSDGVFSFTVSTGKVENETAYDYTPMRAVNRAAYYKTNDAGEFTEYNYVTVIPASSVYFDDDLASKTLNADEVADYTVTTDDAKSNAAVDISSNDKSVDYTFTFSGTGIDIYCTTHDKGGYVSHRLYKVKDDGTKELVANSFSAIRNYSPTQRNNVPTISYTGLDYGTYTVKVTVLKGSQYKLDGVRIYNPAGTTDSDGNLVRDESYYTGSAAGEVNTTFTELRTLLLAGDVSSTQVTDGIGYFFTDNTKKSFKNIPGEDGNVTKQEFDVYTLEAYEIDGPKHEIYLPKDSGIAFSITNWNAIKGESGQIMVGLSAPEGGSATAWLSNGTVDGNDAYIGRTVSSAVDQYYALTPSDAGVVMIVNKSSDDVMLSVSKLKVCGTTTTRITPDIKKADSAATTSSVDAQAVRELSMYIAVTDETLAYAEQFNALSTVEELTPVVTPEPEPDPEPDPTPDPTPQPTPSPKEIVRQQVSAFVTRLLKSLSKLFW